MTVTKIGMVANMLFGGFVCISNGHSELAGLGLMIISAAAYIVGAIEQAKYA